MADVTTYKRCTMAHYSASGFMRVGEVRVATDVAVTNNPQWWIALTDAELTSGTRGFHSN